MQRSYLIQRLTTPHPGPPNPFSFGGGLVHGGIHPDALSVIREAFDFDYMGAAEYEWGAVPKALQRIRDYAFAGDLTTSMLEVDRARVPLPSMYPKDLTPPTDPATIYTLSHRDHVTEVLDRITHWVDGYDIRAYLDNDRTEPNPYAIRDGLRLDLALFPYKGFHDSIGGWLELDNGFMFFTNATMFSTTASIFGLEVPA